MPVVITYWRVVDLAVRTDDAVAAVAVVATVVFADAAAAAADADYVGPYSRAFVVAAALRVVFGQEKVAYYRNTVVDLVHRLASVALAYGDPASCHVSIA